MMMVDDDDDDDDEHNANPGLIPLQKVKMSL